MKIVVLLNVAPCRLVDIGQRFISVSTRLHGATSEIQPSLSLASPGPEVRLCGNVPHS